MQTPSESQTAISEIFPNPNQPRKQFDEAKLEELATSIRNYGVLEPIVVTPRDGRYMIIAGERRFRASLLAGLASMPTRVIDADDELVEELALLENVQRQDLNVIEEAKGYQSLLDRGWAIERLSEKIGKEPWRILERTSLLNLLPEYQDMVVSGMLVRAQAYHASTLPRALQPLFIKKALSGGIDNVQACRALAQGILLVQQQDAIFALQEVSPEERKAIVHFESMIKSIEAFIAELTNEKALKKAVFHSNVRIEQLDLILANLRKLRLLVLKGSGVKEALDAA